MPHPHENSHQSNDRTKTTYPDRYDPNFLCRAILGGQTVITPNGPMCQIATTLQEQVQRDYMPYTLGPSLSGVSAKK